MRTRLDRIYGRIRYFVRGFKAGKHVISSQSTYRVLKMERHIEHTI